MAEYPAMCASDLKTDSAVPILVGMPTSGPLTLAYGKHALGLSVLPRVRRFAGVH